MGCDYYSLRLYKGKGKWADCEVLFVDSKEDVGCVCTFPHNDKVDCYIEGERVYSLALLGAAVKLAHEGELVEGLNYMPDCIPQWIKTEIKKRIITQSEVKQDES